MEIIALNDENRLGTGTRIYLVLKRGRKWVRLLSLGCLRKITVARARAEHARPVEANPKNVVQLLDRLTHYYRYRLSTHDLDTIQRLQATIHQEAAALFTFSLRSQINDSPDSNTRRRCTPPSQSCRPRLETR